MTKTHEFDSTGEAYDACQCDDTIKTGDTLVIKSEGVVGVAHTWPIAVTVTRGEFHTLKTPGNWSDAVVGNDFGFTVEHFLTAAAAALRLGYSIPVDPGSEPRDDVAQYS